jgi:hypothetical protein
MQLILNLSKTNKFVLAAFVFLTVLALGSGRAHAATLAVDTNCTLNEAIEATNNGADGNGCVKTGAAYGTNDTITIPAGTFTLSVDLPLITEPVRIQGAGMSSTVISGGAGQYAVFTSQGVDISIDNLKITAFRSFAIRTENGNIRISNIEVDGQGSDSTTGEHITTIASDSATHEIEINNVYVHNINNTGGLSLVRVEQRGNGIINANLNNITLSDIHSTAVGDSIFGIISLAYGDSVDTTINTIVTNATVDDFTADDNAIPFGSYALGSDGSATVNTKVQNVTITGLRGKTGTGGSLGVKSAAFYAAGSAVSPGDQARATVEVTNSLMADNLNDGVSSNCTVADLTDVIGGSGTDVVVVVNSLGHNISDDASCTSFTQPSDRQNISSILSTLGVLQNDGGSVPTRALLAGSPAIASGSAVLGVTTDARGVARPNTCPSVGAYQFEGAVCAATTTNANAGGAAAPNTGAKTASSLMAFAASTLGISMIAYAFRKRFAVKIG